MDSLAVVCPFEITSRVVTETIIHVNLCEIVAKYLPRRFTARK